MGDWRTVHIIGTCAESEVRDLRRECDPGEDYKHFNCLSVTEGLGGLGDWPAAQINARGNLAERNYTVESVQLQLEKLAQVCPSLTLKVHCGGEYEDAKVVATITLAEGKATIGEPEMAEIAELTEQEMQLRFTRAILLAAGEKTVMAEDVTLAEVGYEAYRKSIYVVGVNHLPLPECSTIVQDAWNAAAEAISLKVVDIIKAQMLMSEKDLAILEEEVGLKK